jgi:hypothetical protein
MIKAKRSYKQPKVEIIVVESENCFSKISSGYHERKNKMNCNNVSSIKFVETKMPSS